MKKIIITLSMIGISLMSTGYADTISQPFTKQMQQSTSPNQALELLKSGNQRFVNSTYYQYDYKSIRQANAKGQYPFAMLLSCIDSRSDPDILFDQGPGNLFIARVAGNVVDTNILGSMEFATKYAGAKLIGVIGHTACGAVTGACKQVGEGNLRNLLDTKKAAVDAVASLAPKDCSDENYIDKIARENVVDQVAHIYNRSATIRELVNSHQIILVGGLHNIATGKVDFFYKFEAKQTKPEEKKSL